MEVVVLVNYFKLLNHLFWDHLDESRIEFLDKRHYKVEDLGCEALCTVVVIGVLAAMVLHRQTHVLVVHIWIFGHKVNINLLLFGVLKHFLSESLEILSQITMFLQLIFNFVYIFLWIHAKFEI